MPSNSRGIFEVQPGSDRRMLGEMSPLERLQWDLAVPDSAPDEHQRAAARRISNALGVPDTSGDGYAWQKGKAGFATGREYLTTMQGIFKDGDIFSATASEELKAFEAADREGRLKLARKAQGWIDAAAHWGATPWRRGYGLAEGHELLAGAPADVVAANARLREDEEARRAYNRAQSASSEPYQERRGADEAAADREALDRWHQQRDEDALMGDYGERLFNEHYNLVWLTMTRGLSPAAREIAEGALKERRLQEDDIARFKGLDEKEQAIVARLIRLSRQRVEGGFWNTLGDMGIEFINGAVRLPANVFKQAGTTTEELTWHFFGDDALLVDPEYKNQQARIEQRLYEALGDYPGLDPSGAEHGYAARSFIGAVSTLPYWGYAAMPGIGLAVVAMDMMQRLDERIAAEGGDPYGKGLEWQAYKAFAGGLYAVTERLQVERLLGANSDFAYRAALVKMFTRHGAGVAKKVVGRIALDTAIESLQEGLQEAIEEHGVSMGLTGQPGWRRAVAAGVHEFGETLGTMGILALGGAGWQAYKQRRPAGKRALAAEARDIYLRNSFLVHDNPYHQQGGADATVGVMARVVRQIDEYRAVWQEEGEAGLARRGDVGAEGAALLNTVFEAEVAEREAMSYIIGRNIVERSRAEADEAGLPYFEHDHARVAEIVAAHGAGAAAALERIGYTQAGAARLVEYFREADKGRAAAQQVAQQVQTRLAAEWARDPAAREALQAQGIAELGELEGLRSLYQQAGTRQGAQRAFDELGLGIAESEKSKTTLSERLVSLFEAEHELATSPAAAAAFRERYMAESRDMALAERVARLSGFEAEAEPEAGPGAYRLTRRDENGQVLGEVVLRQVAEDEIDIEGMYSGEAVEAATRGRAYAVTAAEWEAMGQAEREAYAREHLRVQGGWRMTSARNEAVEATGEQARILTGEIILAEGARSATLYHEAVHAWAAMMREAGMLSEADIKKLQDKYGVAADDAGWFNEEALAEDMREIGAATDFVPEKGLASRFKAAVRRLLRLAEATEQQGVAAEGARRAIFEQIVYGGAWQGVGDFAPAAQQAGSREPGTGDPLAAVNRKPGAQEAEAGTGEQEAGTGEQEAGTSVNAGAATGLEDGEAGEQPPPPAARRKGGKQFWSAATPRGNVRVGGYWAVVPRSRVISDTDRERYDFALQERRRDATVGSNAQVQQIATEGVFDPLRLLDAPDTAGGAPIVVPVQMKNEQGKDETYYMVVSGNGRQRVLDLVEADNRGDTYRNPVREFADEHGIKYDPALMTAAAQPRLVRVMNRKPVGVTVKQVAELSNKNVILQMSPAEQASSDAELIRQHDKAGLFNANRDGMPGKTASAEFLAWFVEAAGDESLMDSKGQPTDVARERARRAMLALVIGQGKAGKATVAAFTEQAETLGLQRQHDALLMASGAISALGELKPEYALAEELSRAAAAMLEIAEERKRGKVSDADSHIAQGDMLDALSPAAEQLLRLLDSKRSAEWMAEAIRRYVELASNIDTTTGDMFGAVNATKAELLERAIRETEPGQGVADMRYSIAARRDADAARAAEEYRAVEAAWRNADGSYKDGWMRAPNGEATRLNERQWVQVRTPSFKAWFGDWENDPENASKVVDGNGEPLVVAHSTDRQFTEFVNMQENDAGWLGAGYYFFGDRSLDGQYGRNVMDVFLNIREPYQAADSDIAKLSELDSKDVSSDFSDSLINDGHDGVYYNGNLNQEWVAFEANQIKSAIGNTGAFSVADGDIRYSLAAARREQGLVQVESERGGRSVAQVLARIERIKDVIARDKAFMELNTPDDREEVVRAMVLRLEPQAMRLGDLQRVITDRYGPMAALFVDERLMRGMEVRYPDAVSTSFTLGLDEVRIQDRAAERAEAAEWDRQQMLDKDMRYSIAARRDADAARAAEEYRAVEAAWRNADGSYKDGWMRAPNGEVTRLNERQWVRVRTPSFKAWFGDWEGDPENASKVVDGNGEPLVVYRGSPAELGNVFEYGRNFYGGNKGFWFTTQKTMASVYAVDDVTGEYGEVKEVFINSRDFLDLTPLKINTTSKEFNSYLRDTKNIDLGRGSNKRFQTHELYERNQDQLYPGAHDGIRLIDKGHEAWVVKVPEQIKSATENTGAFSVADGDIRYSLAARDAERLFDLSKAPADSVRLIPLGQVRVVRQESDKRVANAMRYMQMALDGKGERRAPVQAVDNGDGTVTIVDGTATVRAAERMGVPAVYAEVKPRIPGSFTANSALFVEPQVMAEGKRFGSLDALYEAVYEAAPEFARKLEAVAEAQGFGLKMRKEIKLRDRVEQKLAKDYNGDVNKLLDMVGGTLILQEDQRFGDAVKALQRGGFEVARVKNDFLKKRVGDGYKDIKVNVRLDGGLIAEVILIEQEMLDKKRAMGHEIYKEIRDVKGLFRQAVDEGDVVARDKLRELYQVMERISALYYGAIEGDYDALAADFGAVSAAISSTTSQASSSFLRVIMSDSLPAQNILPRVLTRFPSMISSLKRLPFSPSISSETTSVSRFKKNIGTPLFNQYKTILNDSDGNVNSDIRYALDTRGQAYPKDQVLTAFMAHAIMSGQAVPSRNTMERVADSIGAAGFKYEQAARAARRLAEQTTDEAIRRAAMSSDPQAAVFAVGELARQAARALVREGAHEGDKLGRAREKIGRMSEAVRTRMMQELTGADAAAMETDIDADLAATILAADPATFAPDERPVKVALAEGGALELEQGAAELDAVDDEGGADAPQMTDKQRAQLARQRREREERIQQMLDAARQRGEWQRQRQAERKARAEAEAAAGDEAGADGGAGGEGAAAGVQADALLAGEKVALNLGDKWEVAALMRLWAFDRWKRENPLRNSKGDANRDKLAVEFYRKTAVRTLTDLARKLLEPGFPRETVLRQINDITQGLHAGVIERRSAHVLGTINRHAIRAERKTLVQKFRAEMKRQFVKGLRFQELGLDLDRTLRGAVEEDARYVIRVCELSSEVYRGDTSALAREHQRLELIIADRMGMTDEQGRRLDVGDSDMQLQRALRQLALLDKYGGMVSMMPGEILDLQAEAMSSFAQEAVALQERWQRYDEVITQIREPLVAAIMREVDAPLLDDSSALGRLTDSLMGMLRMRLDYLTRFEGDPAKREAAREAIGEIMDMLARGGREYTIATQDDHAALMQTLREIHKRPDGKPDMQAVRNYLRSLDEKIPLELAQQLTKRGRIGKQQGMTKGQMMQLLVYLDQWASYGDNIRKHGRVGQATLIRTYMHEDPRTGELQPVLTGADRQVIEWLRQQFYAGRREAISAVTERVAGRAVASPDPLYMPVRMQREGRKGLADMYGGAWQPLSGVFSRRVRHGLDVDESASILDMFHNRSHETALLRAYTERGLVIRDILTHQAFQDAVRRFHGERQLREILSQVTQSLNAGKKPGEYRDPAANLAMRVMTYTALGWNTLTPMKQTTSMIVWANRIGFKDFFRHLVNVDRQALRELLARPEARVRWGIQMGSGMSPAEQAAYDAPESSVAKKIFGDWGLAMNRAADKLVSLWIGQGVYRDLAAQYMDQGMSEEAAKDRAASEMFSMVEETQSSTRAENLPQLRREGGGLGRLVTQFAITPLLQIQYEIGAFREWRDLVRHGGTEANIREARNRYMRALVINHVIVPAAILLATNLHKLLTGDEPDWNKEGYWKTVLVAALIGQFSRVFFLGALTESMLTAVFERKAPRSGQLIPAEGVISLGVNMVYPVRDIVLWEMDDLERDLIRAAKSTAVTRLPAKLYERYAD